MNSQKFYQLFSGLRWKTSSPFKTGILLVSCLESYDMAACANDRVGSLVHRPRAKVYQDTATDHCEEKTRL